MGARLSRIQLYDWRSRRYRETEPSLPRAAQAIYIPLDPPQPRFSPGWIADKGSLALVYGIRSITPLLAVYLATWTAVPALAAASKLSAPSLLTLLGLLPLPAQGLLASAAVKLAPYLPRANPHAAAAAAAAAATGAGTAAGAAATAAGISGGLLGLTASALGAIAAVLRALARVSIQKSAVKGYSWFLSLLISLSSNPTLAATATTTSAAAVAASVGATASSAAAAAASVTASAPGALATILKPLSARLARLLLLLLPSTATAAAVVTAAVWALRVWSIAEVGFYLFYRHRLRALSHRTAPEDLPPTPALRRAHIRRLLNNVMASGRCPILFIRAWYKGAEFKDIRHGNLREWVCGSFLNRTVEECSEAEVAELDDTITYIQRATGLAACPGYNSGVECIRFTMDPLNVIHRPLVMYAALQIPGVLIGRPLLRSLGFVCIQGPFFRYWFRASPHWSPEERARRIAAVQRKRAPKGSMLAASGAGKGHSGRTKGAAKGVSNGDESNDDDDEEGGVADLDAAAADVAGLDADVAGAAEVAWAEAAESMGPYGAHQRTSASLPPTASSSFSAATTAAAAAAAAAAVEAAAAEMGQLGRDGDTPHPRTLNGRTNTRSRTRTRAHAHAHGHAHHDPSSASGSNGNGLSGSSGSSGLHSRARANSYAPSTPGPEDPVEAAEAAEGAVVFCHGIGIGAWTYAPLLWQLITRYPNRDVIVPEFDYVSMKLSEYVPSARQTAAGIRMALADHGHESAVVMGHSYGTFVASYCLRFAPRIVEHVVLIDPVCFLIHQVDGPFQFLFAPPGCAQSRVIHFLAQTELGVVHSLARRLWWYQAILWEDHLPSGSSVVLSARDTIVPSAAVRHYLQHSSHRIRLLWLERLAHAGFVANPVALNQVLDCVSPFVPRPAGVTPVPRPHRVPCAPPCPASDTTFDPALLAPVTLTSGANGPVAGVAAVAAGPVDFDAEANDATEAAAAAVADGSQGVDGYVYGRIDTVPLEELPQELKCIKAGAIATVTPATAAAEAAAAAAAAEKEAAAAAASAAAAAAGKGAGARGRGRGRALGLTVSTSSASNSADDSSACTNTASTAAGTAAGPGAGAGAGASMRGAGLVLGEGVTAPEPLPSPTEALVASVRAAGSFQHTEVSSYRSASAGSSFDGAVAAALAAAGGAEGATATTDGSGSASGVPLDPAEIRASLTHAHTLVHSRSRSGSKPHPRSPHSGGAPAHSHSAGAHGHSHSVTPAPIIVAPATSAATAAPAVAAAAAAAAKADPDGGSSTVVYVPAEIPAGVSGESDYFGTPAAVAATVQRDSTQPHKAAVLIGPLPRDPFRPRGPEDGLCATSPHPRARARSRSRSRSRSRGCGRGHGLDDDDNEEEEEEEEAYNREKDDLLGDGDGTHLIAGVRRFVATGIRVCPSTCVSSCCTRQYFAPFAPVKLPGGMAGAVEHAHEHERAATATAAALAASAAAAAESGCSNGSGCVAARARASHERGGTAGGPVLFSPVTSFDAVTLSGAGAGTGTGTGMHSFAMPCSGRSCATSVSTHTAAGVSGTGKGGAKGRHCSALGDDAPMVTAGPGAAGPGAGGAGVGGAAWRRECDDAATESKSAGPAVVPHAAAPAASAAPGGATATSAPSHASAAGGAAAAAGATKVPFVVQMQNYIPAVRPTTYAPPAVDDEGNEARCGPTPAPLILRSLPSPYDPEAAVAAAAALHQL